jgi:uncharacterized protein YgbK (DUF1537 family)
MDTGVQLAKRGLYTVVMLVGGELPPAQAVVISTDSRAESATEAYRRVQEAVRQLSHRTLYKKIDSTLRGNIGPELDGMLDGLGLQRALVAPAFPSAGRTTVDGYHRVHGVLLAESDFARDPMRPARESHVPTLLASQTRRRVGHLPLAVVEQGEQAVLSALRAEKNDIVAADATEPRHLRALALALAHLQESWLACGSAGLAEHWPWALGWREGDLTPFPWASSSRPVVVVAGSRNPSTSLQLQHAVDLGRLHLVNLSPAEDWEQTLVAGAIPLFRQGLNVALTATFSEYRQGAEAATAAMLAQATMCLLGQVSPAGLVVTGGDVARAVCGDLGAVALHVLTEVQLGVPAGALVGGSSDGLRVVTKAGGFGDDLAIAQSIDFIQGRLL